jgi:hypothetical protein
MPEEESPSPTNPLTAQALELLPKVYDDLLHPGAVELGKGVEVIAKAINVVLAPVAGLVWGFDRIKVYLEEEIPKRLEARGAKRIVTPPPEIAVPTLQALTYLGEQPDLRELFTNLLVSAFNEQTARSVHPAFTEIIKQLSPNEARILAALPSQKYFPVVCEGTYAGSDSRVADSHLTELYTDFARLAHAAGTSDEVETSQYLDNLLRLRLVELRQVDDVELQDLPRIYGPEFSPQLQHTRYEAIYVTAFGRLFISTCISDVER